MSVENINFESRTVKCGDIKLKNTVLKINEFLSLV